VKAFGPLLRMAQKPSPCVGSSGDAQHVFYTRLVNDLAIHAIGLATRDRTLVRLQATLAQYRQQPPTFACTLVPRRAPGAPRVACGSRCGRARSAQSTAGCIQTTEQDRDLFLRVEVVGAF
jgi:hypothetical protein